MPEAGKRSKWKKPRRTIPYTPPVPNPMDGVEFTGDIEADSLAEINAVADGWRERMEREDKRYKLAVDGAYYCVTVFDTIGDRDAFLESIGMVDKIYRNFFLDGYVMARALGKPIERK